MNEKRLAIGLEYFKGLFDEKDLASCKEDLKCVGIELIERDKSNQVVAFMDDFTNQVSLLISNPLVQAYVLGLMANGSYDVLKKGISWMWDSLHSKTITKIHMGGKKEEKEATFGLHIKIDSNTKIDFRLTGDVNDELKSKCIDKAFESLENIPRGKERKPIDWFANYSWDRQEWIIINVMEEITNRLQNREKAEKTV